jgi:galactokinase
MSNSLSARDRAIADHQRTWGQPELIVRAPGRVNIIGEHTDYSGGFVLPMAIPFDTVIALSTAPAGSPTVVRSEGFGEVRLDGDVPSWATYLSLMQDRLAKEGIVAPAWVGAVATDIPTGASLSSSAAIEVAVGLAIAERAGVALTGVELARFGQSVETELLGSPTGIMDQLISATAVVGAASLIDCRSFRAEDCPIPEGAAIVVMDTMTRRRLVDSEFPARMEACRRAADLLGVPMLRDVDDVSSLQAEHPLEWQRATHVVEENKRTIAAAAAMAVGDASALGRLLNESHASLRDLYEVSGPALDSIVEIARASPGCFGARMTGGGFAGCALALVAVAELEEFLASVRAGFLAAHEVTPRLWPCAAAAGASAELYLPSS